MFRVPEIELGSMGQQQADHGGVSIDRRRVQRRVTVRAQGVRIGAGPQQPLDEVPIALGRGDGALVATAPCASRNSIIFL
jgi:hypothetical protein